MNWLIRDCTGLENQRIILHVNISLKQRILSSHVMPRIRKKNRVWKIGYAPIYNQRRPNSIFPKTDKFYIASLFNEFVKIKTQGIFHRQ